MQAELKYAVEEGGEWVVVQIHSLEMPDGTQWDAKNGWRDDVLHRRGPHRDLRGRFISPTGKPSRVPRPRTPEEEAQIKARIKRQGENIRRDLAETIWRHPGGGRI